jgi:hypothetical protein
VPNEKLTITLTDRAPVTIVRDHWDIIASAKAWDNTYESQANRTWRLTVRAHDDGRVIVYGVHASAWQGERDVRAGELVVPPPTTAEGYDYLAPVIRRVAQACACEQIADECIADLPAREI